MFDILPLLPLHMVKASKLVTRWIRRRRKGILRRSEVSKGTTKLLPMKLVWTNILINPTMLNSLASYVRVITFLEIVLLFPRY